MQQMPENYKGIADKTPEEIYDSWEGLETLCDEHVGNAQSAVVKLEHLINEYGEQAANNAVFAFIGSDDATMLIDDYRKSIELGYVDMGRWYRDYIVGNIVYMPKNYDADDCYVEFRDALLYEIWQWQARGDHDSREALDAFLTTFCGGTFDGLFELQSEY